MNYFIIIIIFILFIFICLFNKTNNESQLKRNIIKTLLRQCARWSVAAQQDNNELIGLLHANYGAGYLWALRDIFSDKEIEEIGEIDIIRFRDEIVKIQDEVTKRVLRKCPEFGPKKSYLTLIGGEGEFV